MQSSLIVSNYSIRTDNRFLEQGNFPLWLTDFFSERGRVHSRHAHILDFDVLRLGRKVMENNPKAGSFEFGVVGITEIGKERGNNLELKEVKKGTDEANQKNDLGGIWAYGSVRWKRNGYIFTASFIFRKERCRERWRI